MKEEWDIVKPLHPHLGKRTLKTESYVLLSINSQVKRKQSSTCITKILSIKKSSYTTQVIPGYTLYPGNKGTEHLGYQESLFLIPHRNVVINK